MKDKVYRRAVIFMCAAIVFSVVFGGCRSIRSEYSSAVNSFYKEQEGTSADAAVNSIISNAKNLSTVADRYINDTIDRALLSTDGENMDQIHERVIKICNAARVIYDSLEDEPLSEADKTYRTELFYNIKSSYSVLCGSAYNPAAEEYNRVRGQFPARLFAALTRSEKLPVFDKSQVILEDGR